jgi:2-phospho-L-lactate/phosphoenolpyruvate guanylyltransferase
MKTVAIVPVKKFENSKTRLSAALTLDERMTLSSLMLSSTLEVLACTSLAQIVVVSSDRRAQNLTVKHGAKFLYEEKENGVNSAVAIADRYCLEEEGADATIVVPEDLPLLHAIDIAMVCDLAKEQENCIVICPSIKFDGTNLLLRKPPSAMKTHYDNDSYEMHIMTAKELGVTVKIFFSKRLMSDVDTIEDIKQLAQERSKNKTLEFLKDITDNL